MDQNQRRAKFEQFRGTVGAAIGAIERLPMERCADRGFLEREFIPALGLNDEELHEQPPELARYFGTGLHLWQYPNQLASYLTWLTANARDVRQYMEIGCRWGGTLIVIVEWLRKIGAPLHRIIAVDPIAPTPFMTEYFKVLESRRPTIDMIYVYDLSTSPVCQTLISEHKPDFVFIDGDHQLKGAFADHILVRDHANIIVHHDVMSNACPDTTFLWQALKRIERAEFDFGEFTEQYPSVKGSYLGIGVMKRRQPVAV